MQTFKLALRGLRDLIDDLHAAIALRGDVHDADAPFAGGGHELRGPLYRFQALAPPPENVAEGALFPWIGVCPDFIMRHVSSFCPIARAFVVRLVAVR